MIFGRNGNINIGVALHLEDKFTKNANNILSSMGSLDGQAQRMMKRNLHQMTNVGMGMMGMGAAILLPIKSAIEQYASFEYTLDRIEAITEDTAFNMSTLKKKIIDVGTASVYSIQEIAEASRKLAQHGFSREMIVQSLEGIDDMAGATGSHIDKTADFMMQLLNTFNFGATESKRIASLVTYAVNQSALEMDDLMESYKMAGPTLNMLRIPIEDSLAMFMKLGNQNLRGSMAGTAIDNLLRYAARGVTPFMTKNQSKVFDMLGISPKMFKDAQGNLLPLEQLFQKLHAIMKQYGTTDQLAIAQAFVGERGKRALMPLLDSLSKGNFENFRKSLLGVGDDYAARIAHENLDGLYGDILRIKDAWLAFKIEAIDPISPALRFIVQFANHVIDAFRFIFKIPVLKYFAGIAGVLGVALITLGFFNYAVGKLGGLIIAGEFGFASWGKTVGWVFNSATAAAWRFVAASKVANHQGMTFMGYGPGGGMRWRNNQTGKFTKGPQHGSGWMGPMGMGAGSAMSFGLKRWIVGSGLGTLARSMGWIAKGFGFLFGPLGMLALTIWTVVDALNLFGSSLDDETDKFIQKDETRPDGTRIRRFIDFNSGGDYSLQPTGGMGNKTQNINLFQDGQQTLNQSIENSDEDLAINLNQ